MAVDGTTAKNSIPSVAELLTRLAEAETALTIQPQHGADVKSKTAMSAADGLPALLRSTRLKLAALQQALDEAEESNGDSALLLDRACADEIEALRIRRQHERQQLELDLEKSLYATSVLNTLVDTLPVGVVIAGEDGQLLLTNQTGIEILGEPALGTIDQPEGTYLAYHRDGSPLLPEEMPLAVALKRGGPCEDMEILLLLSDGSERIVSAAATPLRDEAGRIAGAVMAFQDITEHIERDRESERLLAQLHSEQQHVQRLVQQLRQERDILRAVMEHTYTRLAYLDAEFNFVLVNDAYVQGTGRPREVLLGQNYFDLSTDAENQAIFEQVQATGSPVAFTAKPSVDPKQPESGTTYWDWTLAPVKDETGQVEGFVLSLHDVTERHRVEAEIASLARFPAENPNPVLRVDRDGTLLYANSGSAPLLRDWRIEVGDRVPLRWQAYVREALRSQINSRAEIRVEGRVFALTVAPSPDGYANIYGLEISELRQVQDALRQYAGRLRTLHDIDQAILAAQSAEAIADATLARLPQMINTVWSAVALFDFEADEAKLLAVHTPRGQARVGRGWRTALDDDWAAQIEQLQRGRHVLYEDAQRHPPTSSFLEMLQAEEVQALLHQPLRAQGQLIGILSLGFSRTDRIEAEYLTLAQELADQLAIAIQHSRLYRQIQEHAMRLERRVAWRTAALRISEARFRAIFEDAPLGIALLDQREGIVQSNARLQAILGQDDASLRDRRLRDAMVADDASAEAQLYSELMRGATDGYRTEVRFERPDEETVWCNLTLALVRDVEQAPRLAVCMVEDITDRRETQAAMVQNEKLALTGQLAASLAHEINNPLQTVIGCLGLAKESLDQSASVGDYLQMASDELKRAAGIVGRLRDLHRPSEPEEQEIKHPQELLAQVVAVSEKQCRDRGIDVTLDQQDRDLPSLRVVPDRIHQVFLNLMLNAIDAMPNGGALTITLKRTADPVGVLIVFEDSGVGIPSEMQRRLFDPFHTTKPDGLGLGLFISQKIIENHDGWIEVESSPGEGTAFSIWLPTES